SVSSRCTSTARGSPMRWRGSTPRRRRQPGWRASMRCHLVRPRAARSPPRRSYSSIPRAVRRCRSGASAAAISSPSIASSPRSSKPISPTACGCASRTTPMPWPIGWRRDLRRQVWRRSGRGRRTRCSSRCRRASTRGSKPRARAITPGLRTRCPTVRRCRGIVLWCAWSPRLPPAWPRSITLSPCCAADDTNAPKLRPIPGYPSAQVLMTTTSGNPVVKQHIAFVVGVLASSIAGPALAQSLPPAYPGAVYPGMHGMGVPAYEVVAIVRSTGLEPLTRPVRNGPAYALRALDPAGQEVRVVVDARNGRIARVVPVPGPRYVDPRYGEMPPYGRSAGRLVPDGYGPGARVAGLPPGAEGAPPSAHAPAVGSAPRPAAQSAPPPLPRPRPKAASADLSAAPPAAAPAPQASPPPAAQEPPAAPPAPVEARPASEGTVPAAVDEMGQE